MQVPCICGGVDCPPWEVTVVESKVTEVVSRPAGTKGNLTDEDLVKEAQTWMEIQAWFAPGFFSDNPVFDARRRAREMGA